MAPVSEEELESWQQGVLACKDHCRKISRAVLALEERLLGIQVQLSDARQPSLLDELEPVKTSEL